jgi:cytidine deaminase
MAVDDLPTADRALVDVALAVLDARAQPGRHEVAAALRTRSGAVYTGLHVESSIGRASICAEGVAIGVAAVAGDTEIDTIVAVLRTEDGGWRVVTPCGLCRELIGDYAPTMRPTPASSTTTPGAPTRSRSCQCLICCRARRPVAGPAPPAGSRRARGAGATARRSGPAGARPPRGRRGRR